MKLFYLFLLSILTIACSKENKDDKNPQAVSIRIVNATAVTLENAQVAGVSYGSILPGFTSEYKPMKNFIYAAFCDFFSAGNQRYAGYGICGTPMPPPYEAGKYTFRVTEPNPGQYSITVTKD